MKKKKEEETEEEEGTALKHELVPSVLRVGNSDRRMTSCCDLFFTA
jgi:hypothetical protein